MKLQENVSTGISGITVELSLAELIVLKNSIPDTVDHDKISYELKKQKDLFVEKMSIFLNKVTANIQGFKQAEEELFGLPKEQPCYHKDI